MPDTNDFDLPRWQTHAEQATAPPHPPQPSYLYPGPPPQRIQPLSQSLTGPSRQPRLSHLLDQDQQLPISSPLYFSSPQSQLSRSASLAAPAQGNPAAATRLRRHHQQDDIEGATAAPRQQQQQHIPHPSFYPPGVPYHPQSLPPAQAAPASSAASTPDDSYSDMYFNGSASHPPKRSQNAQESNQIPRSGRSPLRGPNTPSSGTLLDPYSQQAQYSPSANAYTYATPPDQRSHPSAPSHTRAHSQVKSDSMTPPVSTAYSSHSAQPYTSSYAMDTSSPHPPPQSQTHLSTHPMVKQNSMSNPPTPISYLHPAQGPTSHYYAQDQPMLVDMPPQRRRVSGFRRIRTIHDLQPRHDLEPTNRRMASNGFYLSPLQQLTTNIIETYHICNPQFRYESAHNPRRVLTKPSKPVHNEGYDNEDYDYILYVNDWLGTEEGHKYLILDILGQGTFGQVVKCQNMKTHEVVAVKVVKNKPAYFNQSMMEVTILELLNKNCDPNDEHHILRLRDSFIHRNHLCLVFELLSSNLYELIKQNQFQGLSTQLVKVFMAQLLDALTVLKEARLIHCDLKPENILLKSLQSPQIKVIDFGSACHERQTVYTYIQSRFYRSPEVLLGMSYTAAIDMWSLGCIAIELFLGLPLFPGTSEYNQLTRIIDMLGMPPLSMLNTGKQVHQFFDSYEVWSPQVNQNEKRHRMKSIEQYSREHNTNEQPGKQYFKASSLPELINTAPMPQSKSGRQHHEVEKEMNNRASFIDFCQGLLNLNPVTRWTPQQARMHPFITGEKFAKPFVPDGLGASPSPSNVPDPKRPYGGLVPSQPKGTRAYQDAASYNHHLAQHQAYTAQAQAASQAASIYRNPYITPQGQNPPSASSSYSTASDGGAGAYPPQQYASNQTAAQHRLAHQTSTGQLAMSNSVQHYPNHPPVSGMSTNTHLNPNLPSSSYYPTTRARANTINQMDTIPPTLAPALARLQHMNQDVIGGRNALTPVLNRDDAMREWERRQTGKPIAAQPYPQLEYLQQQAEAVAASGLVNWASSSSRYPPPPSKLSHSFHPPTITVDSDSVRRDVVMSNVRNAARNDNTSGLYGAANMITSPAQAYAGSSTTGGNRYATTYPQSQQPGSAPFESLDRRADMGGNLYVPMQPDQYQSYTAAGPPSTSRHVAPPAQPMAPSFYGAGIVPTGQPGGVQQRPPFSIADNTQPSGSTSKDARRTSGLDAWPR
ncbi:hypothetical protein AX17_003964 [Amanita inopinata Kibby_2008]|nr:hypothetical protein AX17_003964 [Amanita inopinata Kibby_2008]